MMKKRKNRYPVLLVIALAMGTAVPLAACGSRSYSTIGIAENATAAETAAAANGAGETSMYMMSPALMPSEIADSSAEAGSGDSGVADTSGINSLTDAGRKLIRDVNMNVEARDFDGVLSQITSKVNELGGYIEASNVSGISAGSYGGSQQRYGDIKARIPSDKMDGFVKTVEAAGNVINKQEQVTDVTLQYSDIESHKKSMEIEQERLWALLEKADTLDAVVALESRLSEIRYQLESYTSQLRLYDNQVSYSTVSIYLVEVKDLTSTAPDSVGTRIQRGFNRSLSWLEAAGTGLLIWVASSSPILLVLAVMIAAIVLVVRTVIRKADRKMTRRNSSREHPFHISGSHGEEMESGDCGKEEEQMKEDKKES